MTTSPRDDEWILDRWEGDFGVIDGLGPVPRALLPRGLREGDVLKIVADNDTVTLTRDAGATARRREAMRQLRDQLPRVDADGDLIEL